MLKSSCMIEKRVFIIHMSSIHTNTCHCWIVSQVYFKNKLKVALIGQSLFGQEVYSHLCKEGHRVVGVFTVPDKDGKADPLGECILEQLDQGLHWPPLCLLKAFSGQVYLCGGYRLRNSPFSVGLKTKMQAPTVLRVSPLTSMVITRSLRGISKHVFFLNYTCDFPKMLWDI